MKENNMEKSLKTTNSVLQMYNGTCIKPIGECKIQCEHDRKSSLMEFMVIEENI